MMIDDKDSHFLTYKYVLYYIVKSVNNSAIIQVFREIF